MTTTSSTLTTIKRISISSMATVVGLWEGRTTGGDEGFICRGGNLLTSSSDTGGCHGRPTPKLGRAS